MNLCALFSLLHSDLVRLSDPLARSDTTKIKIINIINPRFFPVLFIRLSRYFYLKRWFSPFSILFTWINFFLFGIEVTPKCDIGAGLLLPHTSGTVIGASAIGSGATIFQGVTLGALIVDMDFDLMTRPTLADNVVIGAGAKILGAVDIGSFAKIGANSVVLNSIPANSVAVGIPAVVVKVNK